MKIRYVKGDMIAMMKDPEVLKIPTLFVHGCNCHTAMGSGIAAGIAMNFPDAPIVDAHFQRLFKTNGQVDIGMLGQYSWTPLKYDSRLINLYTQYFPGRDLRLDALENGFIQLAEDFGYEGYRLIFPKIGAGVAGGDWDIISQVIENCFDEDDFEELICVEWDKK